MDETSQRVNVPMVEVPSHRAALKSRLDDLQGEQYHQPSPVMGSWFGRHRVAISTPMILILFAAVAFLAWWAGDTSSVVKTPSNNQHEASPTASAISQDQKDALATPDAALKFMDAPLSANPEDLGGERLKSIEEAIEVVHFKPKMPTYTMGGKIKSVVVGWSTYQQPQIYITYDNGVDLTASVYREPIDFAGQIQGMESVSSQASVKPTKLPYLVDVSGHQGMLWPPHQNAGDDHPGAAVISWWDEGIDYDLSTGTYDFQGDELEAIREVTKMAESVRGRSYIPAPDEKVSIPPNYGDFESAAKATGFKFRIPKYTAGGKIEDVYKKKKDKYADYGYSNNLQISMDTDPADKNNGRNLAPENLSFEAAMAAYRKSKPDPNGLRPHTVDIAGNKGILWMRDDRKIMVPAGPGSDSTTALLPTLTWWEGKTLFDLMMSDDQFFKDYDRGIREMLRIARSMYE